MSLLQRSKRHLKVAIVGGATRDLNAVRSFRDDWEIWGLNAIRPVWSGPIRWSRWFNLHRYFHLKRDWRDGLQSEIGWAHLNQGVPFYVVDSWDGALPNEVIFPWRKLAKLPRGDYHAGSFDWMVAFAAYLGAKEISIHGVNLNMESGEPISARACLEYWCGYAVGKGAIVHIANDCQIFHQYHLVCSDSVYGYDDVRLIEDRRTEGRTP